MAAAMQVEFSTSEARGSARLARRVLRADPSQEYLLFVPSTIRPGAPLLVSVHGVSRNADEHAKLLSAYCEMYGVVLVVPHFSVEQHPDYQRLGRTGRGKRADMTLNSMVAEAAEASGASGERFFLFGFSGGAQFAHRYAMAHPHRIAGAVVASAGWYTLPDPTKRFPHGTRPSSKLPGVRFDAEEFLAIPMKVFVGARDEGSKGLRRTPRLDRVQGVSRVERARTFVEAMKAAAESHFMEPKIELELLDNCDHSFRRSVLRGGLGDKVFQVMFGEAEARSTEDE